MPEIDKASVVNPEWLINLINFRFVRIGEIFYFSENGTDLHSDIAQKNGVTEFNSSNEPIVDDGGFLFVNDDKLLFTNITTSCEIRDRSIARKETKRIAKEKFGEENIF